MTIGKKIDDLKLSRTEQVRRKADLLNLFYLKHVF